MLLWRIALRPDRRLVIAAVGIATAIMLPLAATLVLQGLEPDVDRGGGQAAYRLDGAPLDLPASGVREALRIETVDGVRLAAFTHGDPRVEPDEAWPMVQAPDDAVRPTMRERATQHLPLVPADVILVHPDTLPGPPHVAWIDAGVEVPGAVTAPARGADAFEAAGIAGLRSQATVLVIVSVPGVALVAAVFGDQESRRRARTAATLAALGRPALGRWLLVARVAWMMAIGGALATLVGFLLWHSGPAVFRPRDTQPLGVALAILVPGLLGGAIGMAIAATRLGSGEARLRTPPSDVDLPGRRLGWLPPMLRPISMGTRVMPLLVIAALLFSIDLGFPVAAAGIPAAVAGERGEWVVGGGDGIVLGGHTDAAPGAVLALDPAIDAAVAEMMVPTLMEGQAVLARGGDIEQIAAYHGLRLQGGQDGIYLGQRLQERLDMVPGAVLSVQMTDRAGVLRLPVAGTFSGGGLMEDEALIPEAAARSLTGTPEGSTTVVRMRPDTPEARAVLSRPGSDIQVLDLRVLPDEPVAGQLARVEVDVVNLAGSAGSRDLPVRINGLVAAPLVAELEPWETATLEASFIVPSGAFRLEVNPTRSFQAGAGATQISAPLITFLPDPIRYSIQGDADTVRLIGPNGQVVDEAVEEAGTLQPFQTGSHVIEAGQAQRQVRVGADADRNRSAIQIGATWISPGRPVVGEVAFLHAEVVNLGGQRGQRALSFSVDGEEVDRIVVDLIAGQATTVEAGFAVTGTRMELALDNVTLGLGASSPGGTAPRDTDRARSAGSLQVQVADRVLGDAQRALVGLGTVALASIVTVVYLGTARSLEGRAHIARVLHAMGRSGAELRYRAAWEAAAMAAIAFIGAVVVAKALFWGLAWIAWPRPFAHVLPDPFGWLFVLQAGAAFTAAAALAAYLASKRIVSATP